MMAVIILVLQYVIIFSVLSLFVAATIHFGFIYKRSFRFKVMFYTSLILAFVLPIILSVKWIIKV